MGDILYFQTPVAYFHVFLCILAALQLCHRQQVCMDYMTVFPWIMLIIYGQIAGLIVFFIIIFNMVVFNTIHRQSEQVSAWGRIAKLPVMVGIHYGLWYWLNTNGFYIGNTDPAFYIGLAFLSGILLFISHQLLMKQTQQKLQFQIFKFGVEALGVFFLWILIPAALWPSLYENWLLFALPPFWIFGLLAAWLTYQRQRPKPSEPLRGLWVYAASSQVYLWAAFIILAPIGGALVCLLLYPRIFDVASIFSIPWMKNEHWQQTNKL